MRYWPRIVLALIIPLGASAQTTLSTSQDNGRLTDDLGWPTTTLVSRPWTRWWWLGSAVDDTNLTSMLREFRDAGIGGVEICPIYGVKGYEDHFIPFLSPHWIEMLGDTLSQAGRLGLGVDLTTGTGWPFGGPRVTAEDASAQIHLKAFEWEPGESLPDTLPKGQLQCLVARSEGVAPIDLTDQVRNGKLEWAAPPGHWDLYALTAESPIQKVKRAAPGGEGAVLNPYSIAALDHYLADFDRAFADLKGGTPRAEFHDSFEYYHADWAPGFFQEFERLRGYDLRTQLPALCGQTDEDTADRVRHDFRETLSDLHQAWIEHWTQWAHAHGSLTRDQAHGAPANLVDVYAAADIPETEIFGNPGGQNILMNKLASSAAHLTGRKLSSAESFTWLTEHFQATPTLMKEAADRLFLTGVNHIFFHGIPYSPAEAPWPGWQFYAAVNFGPRGGLWHDLPFVIAYLTRCQSILQSGAPANDVLLYFPAHDFWQTPGSLFLPFTVEEADRWLGAHPVHQDAAYLWSHGYGYDVVSDRLLRGARVAQDRIVLGGNAYRALLIPETKFMPEASLRKLVELARNGATILFEGKLPGDVPGWGELEKRRADFHETLAGLHFQNGEPRRATVDRGSILQSADLGALLQGARIPRESCVDQGLQFVRRSHAEGYHYFLVNLGEKPVDGWVRLGTRAASALILDPRFDRRIGLAALKNSSDATRIYLQLRPGESLLLRTFTRKLAKAAPWQYFESAGPPRPVAGKWKVEFIDGGPGLPAGYETTELSSWTTRDDPELKRFAGTARYTLRFDAPPGRADDWRLDLGRVCESARLKLNGREAGALWSPPFEIAIGRLLKPRGNILEVEVTNLAANRIRDLDQRGIRWKYFYDLNVVGRDYRPLDASSWPLRDSGLLGPVQLKPVKIILRTR